MAQTGPEIVKSTYVCDPSTGLLVKRSDGDHNREYWERVNQGDVVSGMTQLWEKDAGTSLSSGGSEESIFKDQIRVGKLSGDMTRDLFGREGEGKKEAIKVGKLNTKNLFEEGEVEAKREVKVGKINTKNLFENQEKEEPATVRPKMKIGKLDTKRVFDTTNENKENEANDKDVIVVGKLNTKNLFENSSSSETAVPKRKIKVGKINTNGLFAAQENDGFKGTKEDFEVGKINSDKLFEETMSLIDQEEEKAKIKVGKLNVQESNLFENQETSSPERPRVTVGKISTKDLFENSPTEEKQEYKLYKPAVVKKINTANLFQEAQNEQQQMPKAEIKVGKINSNAFLKNATETSEQVRTKHEVPVGKLNANKLFEANETKESPPTERPKSMVGKINMQHAFGKSEETEEKSKPRPKVGKLVVGKLVPKIEERPDLLTKYKNEERVKVTELNSNFEPKKPKVEIDKINPFDDDISDISDISDSDEPDFKVGKLKSSMFENQTEEPVKLRTGGRKLQKGNRISCLIENLHTGKVENETSDEEEKLRDLELKAMMAEKDVFLGKERISSLQNMFSGQETQWVAENKVRHASREEEDAFFKVAAKSDQVAAMKNKFTNENNEDQPDANSAFLAEFEDLKNEGLVGMNKERFATGNIRQVPVRKQSVEISNYVDKKQLKKIGAKFEASQEPEEATKAKPERVVGKLKTKNIFCDKEKEKREEPFKVGKINTKELFSDQENGEERQEQQNLRVGKLNTSNLFVNETSQDIQKPEIRVGKINTNNIFVNEESQEVSKPEIRVGKINTSNIFGNEESQEVSKPEIRVGKINTSNIFVNEESQEVSKPEIRVGKLNTSNIFENSSNNDETNETSKTELRVGKLKTNIFENPSEQEESCESPKVEVRVGKLPSSIFDNPFDKQTSSVECDRDEVRVGKIDTNNVFKYPESETTRTVIKVGKLDTSKVFNPKEDAEDLNKTQSPKVGKLSRDKLFDQDDSDENKMEREIDTHIVPSGKVSESANAFLENAKLQHSSSGTLERGRLTGTSVKRSESSAADMQRKYMEQMQKTEELKKQAEERREVTSRPSVVVTTKMEDAKSNFFQSMMQCGSTSSSAQRLGTSIMPTGDLYHAHPVVTTIDEEDEADEDLVVLTLDDDDDDGCLGDDEDCLEDPVSSKMAPPVTVTSESVDTIKSDSSLSLSSNSESSLSIASNPDSSLKIASSPVSSLSVASIPVLHLASENSQKVPPKPKTSPPALPAGVSQEDWSEYRNKITTKQTSSSSRGKQLFQQCHERQEAVEANNSNTILQGVDLEQIEDEFEKLHREMMGEE